MRADQSIKLSAASLIVRKSRRWLRASNVFSLKFPDVCAGTYITKLTIVAVKVFWTITHNTLSHVWCSFVCTRSLIGMSICVCKNKTLPKNFCRDNSHSSAACHSETNIILWNRNRFIIMFIFIYPSSLFQFLTITDIYTAITMTSMRYGPVQLSSPPGFQNILSMISQEVLRVQPENTLQFIAEFSKDLLDIRESR